MREILMISAGLALLAGCATPRDNVTHVQANYPTDSAGNAKVDANWQAQLALIAKRDEESKSERKIQEVATIKAAHDASELEAARVKQDAGIKLTAADRAVIAAGGERVSPAAPTISPRDETTYERIQRENQTPAWQALQASEVRDNYQIAHAQAVVQAKIAAGIRLTSVDHAVIDAAVRAEADVKAKDEMQRLAGIERNRRYEMEQQALHADRVICEYESHSAGYVGYHRTWGGLIGASIGAAIEQNNVMNLCVNARAASRQ
jgi:hypothetical protein